MKVKLRLGFFIVILSQATSSEAALKSFHLDRGRPGCWDEVRGTALSEEDVKALSADCQNLRRDYLESLLRAEQKPGDYLKKINETLKQSKKAAPPYEAILFAVLSQSPAVISGLKARAGVEQKMHLAFRYAEAALFRLEGNRCEDRGEYLRPFYREVCTGQDSILSTSLTTLNHAPLKGGVK